MSKKQIFLDQQERQLIIDALRQATKYNSCKTCDTGMKTLLDKFIALGGIAQRIEQRNSTPHVEGSNPSAPAKPETGK